MRSIDPESLRGDWSWPTRVRFGPGRIAELPEAAAALGIARPLLVTDPALAQHAIGHRVIEIARGAGLPIDLFADVAANPTGGNVAAGVDAFKAGGHDGVIAFGGGSALDAGKAIALMAGEARPLWDFEFHGDDRTPPDAAGPAAVIAIPTTAGTGSEVARAAVITDEASRAKRILLHPAMLPRQVIADPELTLTLPAPLTAWTGIDALAHGLEALCAPGFDPIADGIALEGVRLVHRWLEGAVADGQDVAARAHLLAAAGLGAIAFRKGLGAMHAMAHPVGGLLDAHHGLTVAVVMPYVLAHNRAALGDRLDPLARLLGLDRPGLDGVLDRVLALRRRLEIPPTLAGLGVGEEHVPTLASRAAADASAPTNPVALDAAGYAALFRAALAGRLDG